MNAVWNLDSAPARMRRRISAVVLASTCCLTCGSLFGAQAGQDDESHSYLLYSLEQCNAVANAVVMQPGIHGAVCTRSGPLPSRRRCRRPRSYCGSPRR